MSRYNRSMALIGVCTLIGSLLMLIFGSSISHADRANRVYWVDTTLDNQFGTPPVTACANDLSNDDCTLRQALLLAASDGGSSGIAFRVSDQDPGYSNGFWRFQPVSELPHITSSTTLITGTVSVGIPQIIIDGSAIASAGGSASGLVIENAGNTRITGLAIINFPATVSTLDGFGIRISGAASANNEISQTYLGVDPRTNTAAGNRRGGLLIEGSANNNWVGWRPLNPGVAILPNVIAGNGSGGSTGDGIIIQNGQDNAILGNYIGVIPSGITSTPLPNTGFGIRIVNGSGNVMGGSGTSGRNTISSNGQGGLYIDGANSTSNIIRANNIGVSLLGNVASPNVGNGLTIINGANNNILQGFPGSSAPLIISGNTGYGVLITGSGTNQNTITGAYIGLNQSGTARLANSLGGIRIQDNASENVIGTQQSGNVISGNTNYGLSIGQTQPAFNQSIGNQLQNNIIGLRPDATTVISNTIGGILVDSGAINTRIGGLAASEGNVISGNGTSGATTASGVVVNATGVVSTTITGNIIGLRRATVGGAYTADGGNQGGGVLVNSNATQVQIGGTPELANLVARNVGTGIQVNSGTTGLTLTANQVLTNTVNGIQLTGVLTPTIRANVANGNGGVGIFLTSTPGALVDTNTVLANTGVGIQVSTSARSTITGNTSNSNFLHGIRVSGGNLVTITNNTANLNRNSGIRVQSNAQRVFITNNTVISNTQTNIAFAASSPFTITNNLTRASRNGFGISITGPAALGRMTNNTVQINGGGGVEVVGVTTTRNITMTDNLVAENIGSGVYVRGSITGMLIQANTVISNTINGIRIGDGGTGTHPQQVRITGNSLTRNGIPVNGPFPVDAALQNRGIVLDPDTAAPGTATNPNHDIEPPIGNSLVINQNGRLTGQVLVDGTPAACSPLPPVPCRIQVYTTNTETRDGQGLTEVLNPFTLSNTGQFTTTLGYVPVQLALTATDSGNNTSRFVVFNPRAELQISPAIVTTGSPSSVITLTHRITNTGNVSFNRLSLDVTRQRDRWTILSSEPSGFFELAAGASRPITVAVRLPIGTDSQAFVGVTGLVTSTLSSNADGPDAVRVQVPDRITVARQVVLELSSANPQRGTPGTQLIYRHTVRNNGNVTTVVNFAANTTVGGFAAPTWITSVSPPSLTLIPGQVGTVDVAVTVSPSASAGPPATVAQTTLTATPSVDSIPDLTQVRTAVDETTTLLVTKATLAPNRSRDAVSGQTITVEHTITNLSNGTAIFRIVPSTTQGSLVSFTLPSQPGVEVLGQNLIRLSNQSGLNTYTFSVNITVANQLLPGQQEFVTVQLRDIAEQLLPNTSAVTTITVTRGQLLPRIWMPLVVQSP